jgi:hypothetical protein
MGDVGLDSEVPEAKLIAFHNGSDDEDALLPATQAERLRNRVMNYNSKVSSFLEVSPDANLRYGIGQLLEIVIFSILPRLQDSVSYSIPVMNITFDFEIAQNKFRGGMSGRCGLRGRVLPGVIERANGKGRACNRASDGNTCQPRA